MNIAVCFCIRKFGTSGTEMDDTYHILGMRHFGRLASAEWKVYIGLTFYIVTCSFQTILKCLDISAGKANQSEIFLPLFSVGIYCKKERIWSKET